MSAFGKKTVSDEGGVMTYVKRSILPTYIVLSALFILWIMFGYLKHSIHQAGVQSGATQAYVDIANASVTNQGCQNGVTITLPNGSNTTLKNVACFQQAPNQGSAIIPPSE